jgi:hypothetical protein
MAAFDDHACIRVDAAKEGDALPCDQGFALGKPGIDFPACQFQDYLYMPSM